MEKSERKENNVSSFVSAVIESRDTFPQETRGMPEYARRREIDEEREREAVEAIERQTTQCGPDARSALIGRSGVGPVSSPRKEHRYERDVSTYISLLCGVDVKRLNPRHRSGIAT